MYCPPAYNELTLAVEHRAAPSTSPVPLKLIQRADALALELQAAAEIPSIPPPNSLDERILAALRDAGHPLLILELRQQCRVRKATLYARLTALVSTGRLKRTAEGYKLFSCA